MNKAPFNFNKWNTIIGWFTFVIALITYTLTVEPTMSFWDCGEYIATAAKLEVGHPPGAPLFQMIGAFFAMFASDNEHIALMVNMTSVVSSAFTILFLFWSSSMILKKLISRIVEPNLKEDDTTQLNTNNAIVILGSSFVGALAYTFSDSFWFNAVEAEVYAMASLFISLLFWLGFALGARHGLTKRKSMVVDHFTSYRIIFWSSLYGSFNDSFNWATVLF